MNKLRLAILVITCLLSMAANAAHRSRAQVKEQPLQTDSVQVRTTTAATDSAQVHTIKAATDSAQVASAETVKGKEKKTPEKKRKLTSGEAVQTWHVQEASAIERPTQPDTLHLNYQIATTPVYINHLGAEWLGNLGLPAQSTVFSERPSLELLGDNMFLNPYRPYYLGVEDVYFYNTRVPYTNISFYTGGYTQHGEDRLKGLFTINANQRLNFGLCFDYLYGRGSFYNQSSDGLNGAFNLSYRGERYSAYFIAGINNFRNFENGGIKNDADLETMTDSYNVTTNLTNGAMSTFRSLYFWTNHQVHLGYKKQDSDDSEKFTFVPVTTISYTLKYEGRRKRYFEKSLTAGFYEHNYYSDTRTRDTISQNIVKNILSVTFREGFKPWAVFSLRAFAEADIEENMRLIADSMYTWRTEGKVNVGGEIFKRTGNTTFGVLGEALLLGYDKRFAFSVKGDFHTVVPLKTCSLTIDAEGHIKSLNPSYFHEHYYSNHFRWENTFNNTWDARGYGKVGIPNKWCDFEVGAGWQGLKEYIYFDTLALPAQSHDFIQIVSGEAKLNLKLWWFRWENKAVIQYSSKQDILPLPLVTAFSNLYATFRIFKVLNVQIGVDCRYNTAYYANAYMPATGQFYVQNKVMCGNYPEMNAYLNMHLKQFRFFVMWYNFSSLFMQPTYFTVPHYPLNPSMVKIGLSWNFYD